MHGRHHREHKRSSVIAWFGIAIILATILVVVLFAYRPCPTCDDQNQEPCPNYFGNDILGGSWYADAILLTPTGEQTEQGIHTLADAPSIVANDSFDATTFDTMWAVSGATLDTTQAYAGTDQSVLFNDTDIIETNYLIQKGINNSFQTYFYVNVSNVLSDSIGDADYFVFIVNFTDSNELIYVIDGYYGTGSNVKSVDPISSSAYGTWIGVRIQQFEQDYLTTFSSAMPNIDGFRFEFSSDESDEMVYLDEWEVKRTPIAVEGEGYWRDEDYVRVQYYAVNVTYNVTISDAINSTNVWIEFVLKLQIEQYDGSIIVEYFLIQDSLLQVFSFNTLLSWVSKVYALPESASVYGEDALAYNFSISAEVFGQFENSTEWAYATDEMIGFDAFAIWWVEVAASINVDISTVGYVVVGSICTVLGFGVVKKKRTDNKKKREELCKIDPNNELCH